MAVRYAIIGVLFALILLYFIGGYYHARRRLSRNLPPLPYHRWMVRSRLRGPVYAHAMPTYQQPYYSQAQGYHAPQGSQGGGYAPPPPAYGMHEAPPPVYQPPAGGSKVAADQHYVAVGEASNGGPAAPAPAAGREA